MGERKQDVDMPLKLCSILRVNHLELEIRVRRAASGADVERTWRYLMARKGAIGRMGWEGKGVRKRNAADGAPLAVTDGTMGPTVA